MDAKTKRDHSIPFPSQTTTATRHYCITLARFPFISYIVSFAAEIQTRYYKTDGTTNITLHGHTQSFAFR